MKLQGGGYTSQLGPGAGKMVHAFKIYQIFSVKF
jgi:hypothetical protein